MLGSKSNFARPETTEASFAGWRGQLQTHWRSIFGSSLAVQFKISLGCGVGVAWKGWHRASMCAGRDSHSNAPFAHNTAQAELINIATTQLSRHKNVGQSIEPLL